MEYNAKAAQEAQDEVKDIVNQYPEYAKRILELVSGYEKDLSYQPTNNYDEDMNE